MSAEAKELAFWGLKVPAGKTVTVAIQNSDEVLEIVHVTNMAVAPGGDQQAALQVTVNGQDIVLGHLSKTLPQHGLDFILESTAHFRNFGKSDVHLAGYKTTSAAGDFDDDDMDGFDSEEDEEDEEDEDDEEEPPKAVPIPVANGKGPKKVEVVKAQPAAKPSSAAATGANAKPPAKKLEESDEGDDDDMEALLGGKEFPPDSDDDDPANVELGSDDIIGEFDDDEEDEDDDEEDFELDGEEDDDEDDDDEMEGDDDEDDEDDEDEFDDEDDEDDEEEEAAPSKPLPGSKRPAITPPPAPQPAAKKKTQGPAVPASAPAKVQQQKGAATPAAATPAAAGKKDAAKAATPAAAKAGPLEVKDEKAYEAAIVDLVKKAGGKPVQLSTIGQAIKKPGSVPKVTAFIKSRPKVFKYDDKTQHLTLA